VLVDARAERPMTDLYVRITGDARPFAEHVYASKRLVLRASFSSEVSMLAQALLRIAEADRRSRDFTLRGLTAAIVEPIACFPVYRTYVRPDGVRSPSDERHVERAISRAQRRAPWLAAEVFDFLRDVLLMREPAPSEEQRARIVRFAMRFQQATGPVMAKGVE